MPDDYRDPHSAADADQDADASGGDLDADDHKAMRRLAERAGLVPSRHGQGNRRHDPGDSPQTTSVERRDSGGRNDSETPVRRLAELLVGDLLDLPPEVLAAVADARADRQEEKGGKAAATQYRHCAHHLRQASRTLTQRDVDTHEDRAATTDLAAAYVEAAHTHAQEASITTV
ncbi:hypothetical protein ACFWP3_37830 [Streptomyces sp. NPDC058525]|uniref:hypothetical protein n=1 Tax=Streptomyces sp. NPDC058525 TaxID=3346538 RepID=UPI00365F8B90